VTAGTDIESPALLRRYDETRAHTERLAEPLSAEDQTVQSMPDASPTKWHRAHTSWFFETFLLEPRVEAYRAFHEAYAYLFNSYYEAVGPRHPRPERGLLTRPGIDDIARYRAHVDKEMSALLDGGSLDGAGEWLVELGINHEQQHQELLLMDIKHALSVNPLRPAYDATLGAHPAARDAATNDWRAHAGGLVGVGHDGEGFAFDNELPHHRTYVQPFLLASQPATCAEWLAFMADGGYARPELWLSEGWSRAQADGWRAPLYWFEDGGGGWDMFTLRGLERFDPSQPVCHISYFEADAYARWSGGRLPTEFEWEAARPNDAGQVWEWTASSYAPYPGFAPAPGAVGEYNGKFMVNQYVLRGGCCATPAGHARPTYRNFFPASARWAFSGVRVAKDPG
jgi:ergothioneine biosynthesis protein EgtB